MVSHLLLFWAFMMGLLLAPPRNLAGINDLLPNYVAGAQFVSAFHRHGHARLDGGDGALRRVPWSRKKPRRGGRGVQSGEFTLDQ